MQPAAHAVAAGKLVAFPTETVYGLGANAFDEEAVKNIFVAKGRPTDNPLIVHISDLSQLTALVASVPEKARLLMTAFWPGPLTLVFPKSARVPDVVTAGGTTVAIRFPSHPIAQYLIRLAGVPIAAPSANRSGRPSPTTAEHVRQDFQGEIGFLIDAGPSEVGLESTVLDVTDEMPVLLRSGGISREEIEAVIGPIALDESSLDAQEPARSPGQKYRHYAPQARVVILPKITEQHVQMYQQAGQKVAVCGLNQAHTSADLEQFFDDVPTLAHHLFAAFRQADEQDIDVILVEAVDKTGLGLAVMNRLERASQA